MLNELSREMCEAILETVRVELTVLDAADRIIGWNRDEARIFDRPARVMGRDVRACHSEKSLGMVERMLHEMKSGSRDAARFWYEEARSGERRKLLVEYFAVRDRDGRYLGCIEALQDITEIAALTGERRTLEP